MDINGNSRDNEAASKRDLSSRQLHSVYLITYSQADTEIVSSRDSFAVIVLDSFQNADPQSQSQVVQWVCSEESHKEGGIHYHMAVKLDRNRRWLKVRNYADTKHGVKLNFSSVHANYYSAWKYATKEDAKYLQSQDHPDLQNSPPKTQEASEVRIGSGKKKSAKSSKRKRKPRLSVFDVSQIVIDKGIKTRTELLALANAQKKEGKTDLAEFITNRGYKAVDEAITIGWDIEQAPTKLQRTKKTRMEILSGLLDEECIEGCHNQWLSMARDILQRNTITESEFSEAVRSLLIKGRGKNRNILLIGPCNCGKTFLLNPLNAIYNTFTNPATTSFAWVGAQSCEVVFLNDFRWSEKIIPWHDLLLLLEGQTVHLPAPKSYYSKDIEFTHDAPIFCTGKDELVYVRGGSIDSMESAMMRCRWRISRFYSQIDASEQKEVQPCPRCFAELVIAPSHSNSTA